MSDRTTDSEAETVETWVTEARRKVEEGTFKANDSIIESGNFTIDMMSIEVTDLEGDDKKSLEAHLKGTVEGKEGDFFNVLKYPTANFVVTGVADVDGKLL